VPCQCSGPRRWSGPGVEDLQVPGLPPAGRPWPRRCCTRARGASARAAPQPV
jgi:hypothetical protein